jgi:predicted lipoprotein with Yx(FWY)xxD motif
MKTFPKAQSFAFAAVMLLGPAAMAAAKGPDLGVNPSPPGITIQPLGRDQGYSFGGPGAGGRERLVFADAKGLTLYTYAADTPGKSTCTSDCAKDWPPALAPAKPMVFGAWSVITREDGEKQWAYQGKPLYTSSKDVDPGSWYGNSPANDGPKRKNGAGVIVGKDPSYLGGGGRRREGAKETPLPEDWKIAELLPVPSVKLPVGFAVKEVQDALGIVLVDWRKRTLYVFAGDPNKDARPNSPWVPAEAPQLSQPVGDFGFVVRNDGRRQWTYKGKGLYTYAPDMEESYADGIGVDKDFDVAAIYRYYTPVNVRTTYTPSTGKILASAQGITLYRREAHSVGQTHGLRRSQPLKPAVGRDLGINPQCDGECRAHWHPFPAASNQPDAWGQWTVYTHPDGFRQLAYQGYALWTHDGDKKPGDINGHDEYLDFQFSGLVTKDGERPAQLIDLGTPQDGPAALYWAVIQP